MASKRRNVDDLRGASRLAIEATRGVTEVVEAMHVNIGGGPDILGRPIEGPLRLVTGLVYGGIRGVTVLVGAGIDAALAQLAPLLGESAPGPEREAVLAILNGVIGDHLLYTGNPLAIAARLRSGGHPLELERDALRAALPGAGAKLLVLVHGCCSNDLQWCRRGHDHGAALARDLGYTPVHFHYNSGLHISTNGRLLAALLERLVAAWPERLDELAILAHSMGGLVSRAACHEGETKGHAWRTALRRMVFLGSPHHGAPLERGGAHLERMLDISRYSSPIARLARVRSAGVTDMRFGNVLDEHWQGRDRLARGRDRRNELSLPDGVMCYAVAATTSPEGAAALRGDGLVPVDSALGRHPNPRLTLAFPAEHQLIANGVRHLDLLSDQAVYATIRRWLSAVLPAKSISDRGANLPGNASLPVEERSSPQPSPPR